MNEEQSFLWTVCKEMFEDISKLTEHVKANHTFECTMCDFEGLSTTVMENHILEKHYSPDANNMFSCDECNFKCKSREALGKHFHAMHKHNPESTVNVIENEEPNNEDEATKLKEELRSLRNNFERLESLFQDSLEEVNNVRSAWTQDQDQDPSLPLQCSRAGRKPPPSFPTLSVSLNLPPTITLGPAWRTPNQIYQPHATLA